MAERPITVLAFDYGTSQIGVAVGQALTATATPLAPLLARDGIPNWDEISELIGNWKPDRLLVGLPLNMDGSDSDMSRRATKFSNRLHGRFNLPVITYDERLTSQEAKLVAQDYPEPVYTGRPSKTKGGKGSAPGVSLDSLAAKLLLESWFREDLQTTGKS